MAESLTFTTLISAGQLKENRAENWVIIDCRTQLGNPDYGREVFTKSRIPGAHFAHLEKDLSGPIIPGATGRHPLPDAEVFQKRLAAWGINQHTQVIAYDDAGGPFASRLWWMMNWLGHTQVAVLDGGWPAWIKAGAEVDTSPPTDPQQRADSKQAPAKPNDEFLVNDQQIVESPDSYVLIDARGADRFAGQNETIDPVAGHIPGALSFPFMENLDPDGKFLTPSALAARFQSLQGRPVVSYCGSGVTACHNILAMKHAGLPIPRLYAGSWSEWITDPGRPIATGQPL